MSVNLSDFSLPENLGRVTQAASFDSPFVIFKLEDAYFAIDTQKGLIEILRYLNHQYDIKLVCLEGASGDFFDFSQIKRLLHQEDHRELQKMFRERTLSGPEYIAITGEMPLKLFGTDDPDQYTKNVDALTQTQLGNNDLNFVFESLEKYVSTLREIYYPPELFAFDTALRQYNTGIIKLAEFINDWLLPYSDWMRPHNSPAVLRLDRYPNLKLLVTALKMETRIEFPKVRPELNQLINAIIERLQAERVSHDLFDRVVRAKYALEHATGDPISQKPRSSLVQEYTQYAHQIIKTLIQVAQQMRRGQTPKLELYDLLVDISTLCGFDLAHCPNLMLYIHYIHQAEVIKRRELLKELQRAIRAVEQAMLRTNDERVRHIARASRLVANAYRLCRLEATPDDCDEFLSEFGRLTLKGVLDGIKTDNTLSEEVTAIYDTAQLIDNEVEQEGYVTRYNWFVQLAKLFEQQQASVDSDDVDEGELGAVFIKVILTEVALEGAYKFYQYAPSRGRIIAENTLKAMKDHNVTSAVLITGGFLTNQIMPVFERESVSYVVVLPENVKSAKTRTDWGQEFGSTNVRHQAIRDFLAKIQQREASEEHST